MKRPMTLTGGILGTVANAIFAVMYVLALTMMFEFIGEPGFATIIIVAVLELAVFVVGLVLSILSIVAWNKDADAFKKKKAMLIVCAAFNLVGAVLGMITGYVLYIVLALVLVAAAVLFIVDVSIENKRVAKTTTPAVEKTSTDDVEDKIEKLNQMKSQGMISEEEYEELKKSYINEKLNG